jgi:hypothetical protein
MPVLDCRLHLLQVQMLILSVSSNRLRTELFSKERRSKGRDGREEEE